MSIVNVNRIKYLDQLIKTKSTGTPKQLSNRLNISERCLYYHIKILKELGAPVKFCKKRNSYYYTFEGRLIIKYLP
jgi:transcriptional antiterminator